MEIIISNANEAPIYEQIASQIKQAIANGELKEGDALPSIRALANDLRVSVITTKRAYSELETSGFVDAVQGKGFYVAGNNAEIFREEQLKKIEENLLKALDVASASGTTLPELHEMLDILAQS